MSSTTTTTIYHASTWGALAAAVPGDQLTLVPGTQCAEGVGVYFAEGAPRVEAADAVHVTGQLAAVVVLEAATAEGWWRTKPGRARKYGRPRTWHSKGKSISLTVRSVGDSEGIPHISCDWRFC